MAICASGWDCDKNKPGPVPVTNFDVSAIVSNSEGQPAINGVGFWEDQEFVIDIFVLAKDSADKNKTHLYVHELIPLKGEDQGWKEFVEDFKECNQIPFAERNGSWGSPGDFTRRVSTGSGIMGERTMDTTVCSFEVRFCGHRDAIKYAIK